MSIFDSLTVIVVLAKRKGLRSREAPTSPRWYIASSRGRAKRGTSALLSGKHKVSCAFSFFLIIKIKDKANLKLFLPPTNTSFYFCSANTCIKHDNLTSPPPPPPPHPPATSSNLNNLVKHTPKVTSYMLRYGATGFALVQQPLLRGCCIILQSVVLSLWWCGGQRMYDFRIVLYVLILSTLPSSWGCLVLSHTQLHLCLLAGWSARKR